MKGFITVTVLVVLMFAVGCGQQTQVKVTYKSDPPGGTLYKQNGEEWGPCPKTLWYDVDNDAAANRYLEAKGLIVRWPDGEEKASDDLIRIRVNGSDRQVTFQQPTVAAKAVDAPPE